MTEKDQDKASNAKQNQGPGLSRRDMDLARLEVLLAEQHLPTEPEEDDGAVPQEADEVNLEEAVEIAKLPPKPKAEPAALPAESISAVVTAPAVTEAAPAPPKKSGSLSGTILKLALLLVVLAAVFVFGLAAGRGHIWKAGPGQDLIVWIEQTAGLVPKPEKKEKTEGQKPGAAPAESEEGAGEESAGIETNPDEGNSETTDNSTNNADTSADTKNDEMPVWDWPGWTPADMDEEETDSSNGASVEPGSAGDSLADGGRNTAGQDQTASADVSRMGQAEEDALGDWPTAIEPDQTGLYTPPSDQEPEENVDYEAMLEPSDAPDATYAEAAPLPPAELSLGKFAVQVELAANENEAKNKRDILTRQGFPAYYTKDPKSKSGFSIRVGHYDTRQDADAVKVRLEDLGYEDPTVSSLTGTSTGG